MLNLFRKNTKAIIWTVIVAFLLWGGFSVGTQMKDEGRFAGQVFGKSVTHQEFDRFYRSTQIFNFTEEDAKDPDILRESAWQGVIFSREAKRLGIDVSDNEVREHILKILAEQKVSPENYETWVERGLRTSPQHFEEMVRETLRIRKLLSRFEPPENALNLTEDEIRQNYYNEKDKISAEFTRFPEKKAADLFREKLKTPEDWQKEKDKKTSPFTSTGGLVPAAAFFAFLQLSPEDTLSGQLLEKDHFSGVMASGKEFCVFYVMDKQRPDEKAFEAEKKAYADTLKEKKRQNLMVEKTREILDRAQLTDYLKTAAGIPQ